MNKNYPSGAVAGTVDYSRSCFFKLLQLCDVVDVVSEPWITECYINWRLCTLYEGHERLNGVYEENGKG